MYVHLKLRRTHAKSTEFARPFLFLSFSPFLSSSSLFSSSPRQRDETPHLSGARSSPVSSFILAISFLFVRGSSSRTFSFSRRQDEATFALACFLSLSRLLASSCPAAVLGRTREESPHSFQMLTSGNVAWRGRVMRQRKGLSSISSFLFLSLSR